MAAKSKPTPEQTAGLEPAPAIGAAQVIEPAPESTIEPDEHAGVLWSDEPVLRVRAPAGPRRRASRAFGPAAVDIPLSELGATPEAQQAAYDVLAADPFLAVILTTRTLPAAGSPADPAI